MTDNQEISGNQRISNELSNILKKFATEISNILNISPIDVLDAFIPGMPDNNQNNVRTSLKNITGIDPPYHSGTMDINTLTLYINQLSDYLLLVHSMNDTTNNIINFVLNNIIPNITQSASNEVINGLKFEENPNENKCQICLTEWNKDAYKMPSCKHCFHKDCITKWLEKNNTCPLCRNPEKTECSKRPICVEVMIMHHNDSPNSMNII